MSLTAVHARISEETPRDLRGVRILRDGLERALGVGAHALQGRTGPYRRTHWREDLEASRAVLQDAATLVARGLQHGAFALTVGSDCSIALATLPAVAAHADVQVLWLDAHADYDTPDTQTYDFLGCMSLAGACGAWSSGFGSMAPERVVHVGARSRPGDFDYDGQEQGRRELGAMLRADAAVDDVLAALDDRPVYVHFDPDVLDPVDNPVPYGRPCGMRADHARSLAAALAATHDVIGLEVAAFHSDDDPATRERVAAILLDVVTACAA